MGAGIPHTPIHRVLIANRGEIAVRVIHACQKLGLEYSEDAIEHLLAKHFVEAGRPLRYCHPRDLLLQVKAFAEFHDLPLQLTAKAFDVAVKNYFAGL